MIKTIILASAVTLSFFTTAQATVPALDAYLLLTKLKDTGMLQLAKSSNSGSGNSGQGNSGGGHDDSHDDDSDDNDSDDDNDNDVSGSGRDKPRIPGGSGCDNAGDVAEHPECAPQ